jgi:ATP-binding cassette subfamily B protein
LYPVFNIFASQLNSPLANLSQGFQGMQICIAAGERIFDFLEEKEMDPDLKDKKIKSLKGNVDFKHVKFGYSADKTIINDFSVNIKPGMKVAIVGPTGAGKTTIVNLLMRFYEIDSGSISIDGISIKDMNKDYLRSLFGMVLQDA